MARSSFRVLATAVASVVALGVLGGCATGDYTYTTTISTGERLTFPLIKGLPEQAKSDGLQVLRAGLVPGLSKTKPEAAYIFAFSDKSGATPQSVVVEDVSDETAVPLVKDLHPTLTNQRWTGSSKFVTGDDPWLKWITYLDDTIRVFRFTITRADGRKVVLHQAWIVPGIEKAAIRGGLEVKS